MSVKLLSEVFRRGQNWVKYFNFVDVPLEVVVYLNCLCINVIICTFNTTFFFFRNFLTFQLKIEESTLLWWLRWMNLLETLQKLLKEVDCMTTLFSFSRQITEALHEDLTGKKMASLNIKVVNELFGDKFA